MWSLTFTHTDVYGPSIVFSCLMQTIVYYYSPILDPVWPLLYRIILVDLYFRVVSGYKIYKSSLLFRYKIRFKRAKNLQPLLFHFSPRRLLVYCYKGFLVFITSFVVFLFKWGINANLFLSIPVGHCVCTEL